MRISARSPAARAPRQRKPAYAVDIKNFLERRNHIVLGGEELHEGLKMTTALSSEATLALLTSNATSTVAALAATATSIATATTMASNVTTSATSTMQSQAFDYQDYVALKQSLDFFFIIINAILIFMMQAGFALLEAGSIRSHNTTNILLTNCMDAFVCCLSYWTIGFAFAHGDGGNFIGHSYWFGTYPIELNAKWFFHYVFAAATPTIVSGALAERCDFYAYLLYSFVLTGFIYPVVSRWAWYTAADGSVTGWLSDKTTIISGIAFQDFAGSGVVHLCGGTAALVAVVFLGPRIGRFDKNGKATDIQGHSIPLMTLGGVLLMFGFFAFNGGSQFSISKSGDGAMAARAVVNTIISGSSAGITALVLRRIVFIIKTWGCYCSREDTETEPPWSIIILVNGALTGMVAICSGCNVMNAWGAFLTGFFVAFIYYFISWVVVKLKIDDPVDALAVHFGGGFGGLLATPFMDATNGILVTRSIASGQQLAVQIVGALAIIAWTGSICTLLFVILKFSGLLRVSKSVEVQGLDMPKHHEPAYPSSAYVDGWHDIMKESMLRHLSLGQVQLESDLLKTGISSDSMASGITSSNTTSTFASGDGMPQLRHFAKT